MAALWAHWRGPEVCQSSQASSSFSIPGDAGGVSSALDLSAASFLASGTGFQGPNPPQGRPNVSCCYSVVCFDVRCSDDVARPVYFERCQLIVKRDSRCRRLISSSRVVLCSRFDLKNNVGGSRISRAGAIPLAFSSSCWCLIFRIFGRIWSSINSLFSALIAITAVEYGSRIMPSASTPRRQNWPTGPPRTFICSILLPLGLLFASHRSNRQPVLNLLAPPFPLWRAASREIGGGARPLKPCIAHRCSCALAPIVFWLAIRVPVKQARTMEGGVRHQSTQVPRPRANRVMYCCRSSFIAMSSRAFCMRLWQSFSVGYRYFHRVFVFSLLNLLIIFPRPWARWTLYAFMIYSYLPSYSGAYTFIFLLLLLDLFHHLVLRFAVRFSFSFSFDYSLCKKWLSFIFITLCFVLFFCVLSPLVSSALHPVSVVSPLKMAALSRDLVRHPDPHAVSCPEWSSLRL